MSDRRELGDLGPIRAMLADVAAREEYERAHRAADDAAVITLREVRQKLEKAIAEAENPHLSDGLTVEEYGQLMGLTKWGVYARIRRGALQAEKRPGRGFVIQNAA